MALNGNDRATAVANAIIAAYGSALDAGEQTDFITRMQVAYSADTTYLTNNADIEPGTFTAGGDAVAGTGELS